MHTLFKVKLTNMAVKIGQNHAPFRNHFKKVHKLSLYGLLKCFKCNFRGLFQREFSNNTKQDCFKVQSERAPIYLHQTCYQLLNVTLFCVSQATRRSKFSTFRLISQDRG